jgi:hypothetical protein
MTLAQWKFDGSASGTSATAALTGASLVSKGGGAMNFQALAAAHGACGLEAISSASQYNIARFLGTASNQFAASLVFSVPAAPVGATAQPFGLRNSTNDTLILKWSVDTSLALKMMDAAGTQIGSTYTLTAGTKYRVEIVGTGASTTAGAATVHLYTLSGGTLVATWSTTTANMTANTPTGWEIGQTSSGSAFTSAFTFYWDDVQWSDGATAEIGSLGTAPTVTLSATQSVAAAAAVTCTASASDDGSISSYAWTVVAAASSSTPTLTGASTSSVSFTAPAVGNLVTLQCVVTDNEGMATSRTCEVRVPLTGSTAIRTLPIAATSGSWSNVGGASTAGAALADESDTTYLESGSVSGTEQAQRQRLQPATTRTAGTMSLRLGADTGTVTLAVRILEGATLRQNWTQTATSTPTDYAFALSSDTVSAITDWGNLYAEVGATT